MKRMNLLLFLGLMACKGLVAASGAEVELLPTEEEMEAIAADTATAVTEVQTEEAPADESWWQPEPGLSWQWVLIEPLEVNSIEYQMYDIDLFDNHAETVRQLQQGGAKVVCYISAGSREDWRPDAGDFPAEVLGNDYDGWEGERWLDIRRIDLLAPIMEARLDLCAAKGFDGIEPDNIDGYTNDTGFQLSYADQVAYNQWLAEAAHQRGLSIGLKNAPEMVEELLPHFDWALTEDCFEQDWCDEMLPFVEAGKAVFAAEYTDTDVDFGEACQQANQLGIALILKNRDLDEWVDTCN